MGTKYAIGVDFGTESGRAVLVDVRSGRELATAIYPYQNGVIDERLPAPDDDIRLEPDWALQDPLDYIRTLQETVPAVLRQAGVDPADVVGIGIDFTACTMLPKQLGRIGAGGGHRVLGRRGEVNRHRGIGWNRVHVAVDDHSRIAYARSWPMSRRPPTPPSWSGPWPSTPATASASSAS